MFVVMLLSCESKEFLNIDSLAVHAFNSAKAQRRAEHLGFHKALCLLLGWSDTAGSDGLWVKRLLPEVEASNLKNDLIIWPPVVLVHNSSIAHHGIDKRMTVSIEGLQAILRDMGFGGGKTKVSRGKPGNFSILIVTFKATFSGLQEANKLHKFYADNKRGRTELQQINDGRGLKDSNETQYVPGNEDSALYGYLGNAQDLDKLDFENKKHSVVKSKKEIQAIADANLRAD
ncbi:putative XS domain-containing protein [Lupinus albus]|uniref:Putative XS domain-containing protein n=1 Tax=Lupinus albus TaxID=3870 RepID=A0A6A4PGB7_LUPAL|nr:putative XS domain-containing protein [Lupinus albus]